MGKTAVTKEEKLRLLEELLDEKMVYFKKDGKVVMYEHPSYGNSNLVCMDDSIIRIEENKKISV